MARRDEGEMAPTSEIHGRSMRDPCEIHVSTCRSMRAVGSQRLRSVADGSTLRSTPPAAAALALHRAGRRERDGLQSWRAEMLERICRRAVASHISQRAVQHRCMGRDTASTVCFRRKSYFYFKVRNERPENGDAAHAATSAIFFAVAEHFPRARVALLAGAYPARMAPASRVAVRLADLSHGAAPGDRGRGLRGVDPGQEPGRRPPRSAQAVVQWAVEGVLLSSDLVPHLLVPLKLEDSAAAAVCSRWAEGWKATSEGRRHQRGPEKSGARLPSIPQDLLSGRSLSMAVVPGGDELVVKSGSTICFLGRDMSVVSSFETPISVGYIAAATSSFTRLKQMRVHPLFHSRRNQRSRSTKILSNSSPTLCSPPVGCSSACCTSRVNTSRTRSRRPRRPDDAASPPVWAVAAQLRGWDDGGGRGAVCLRP